MKALVLLHRWLGVGFCLLFAMWVASGIVMHFVPFPELTEAARFAGLPAIDVSRLRHGPDEAAFINILTQPRNALCKQYQKILEIEGVRLEFTPESLRAIAKLGGGVELVAPGSLPNDGKMIADERPVP